MFDDEIENSIKSTEGGQATLVSTSIRSFACPSPSSCTLAEEEELFNMFLFWTIGVIAQTVAR
jgi:hypothetical protein